MTITIYKLHHIEDNKKKCYVGSTANYEQRKYNHLRNCYNQNTKQYDLKVYRYIRQNGGFEAWTFTILEQFDNLTTIEKLTHENRYIQLHNAKLNCNKPGAVYRAGGLEQYQQQYRDQYFNIQENINNKNALSYARNMSRMVCCYCLHNHTRGNRLNHLRTKKCTRVQQQIQLIQQNE